MEQFKKAKVVLLPTEKETNLILDRSKLEYITNKQIAKSINSIVIGYQLYIISDEEIKEGDWTLFFDSFGNLFCKEPQQYLGEKAGHHLNKGLRKIIASTNTSLSPKLHKGEIVDASYPKEFHNILPQPSQQFIEQYIESYNKGEVITDVLVEYEYFEMNSKANYKGNYDFICPNCKHIDEDLWYSKQPTYCTNCSKLKINPDNIIIIKSVKDNWNREEVRGLLIKLHDEFPDRSELNQWLIKNL